MNQPISLGDSLGFIEKCLEQVQQLALVTLSDEFIIESHNLGFLKLLGVDTDLSGKELQTLLLPESQPILKNTVAERKVPVRLNFIKNNGSSVSLDCRFCQRGSGYLLFGDHAIYTDDDTLKMMTILNNEMAALTRELNSKNRALIEAQAQVKRLSGIIPICMYCKEIRDDTGYWNELEKFITENSEAEISHGICDKCMAEKFGDKMAERVAKKVTSVAKKSET